MHLPFIVLLRVLVSGSLQYHEDPSGGMQAGDKAGLVHLMLQTENEAAMQQIKRLRLEHAHSLQHLTEENARLQRTLAHIQVMRCMCTSASCCHV